MELLIAKFGPADIGWKEGVVITGNAATDQALAAAVKAVVDSRIHDRLLGVLSEKYRQTFFIPAGA